MPEMPAYLPLGQQFVKPGTLEVCWLTVTRYIVWFLDQKNVKNWGKENFGFEKGDKSFHLKNSKSSLMHSSQSQFVV
jgi:hypothetical protein